jgi:hypothetical protein
MKKLLIIAAFTLVVSLAASSAMGRPEVRNGPNQQQSQQQDQAREKWQRDQWQKEQDQHNQRHEPTQAYDKWLEHHSHDYDNRSRG